MMTSRERMLSLAVASAFALALPSCLEDEDEWGTSEEALLYTLRCQAPGTGFGAFLPPAAGPPFVPLTSLQGVPNPALPIDPASGRPAVRADLQDYVADLTAAIQLGKALFWDVQVGSDGKVACATCHFQAGADGRVRHQLHPGANHAWDGHSPNHLLVAADFPFTDRTISADIDSIAGSQGIGASTFVGLGEAGDELTRPIDDPLFGSARQVTARNAPSVINAVFNHRNFLDGRAQPEFNGVTPWGNRDSTARVWVVVDTLGSIGQIDLHIPTASLASQAVGPPLSRVEMSASGRTFPDIGWKLLLLKPLALQAVHSQDSVLGSLAEPSRGLQTTYGALVQRAFRPKWWDSRRTVAVGPRTYSLMQANFSLFFGISIMLYEATLVSDRSPMDDYAASRVFDPITGDLVSHAPAMLDGVVSRLAAEGIAVPLPGSRTRPVTRADILAGLDLFEKPLPLPGAEGIPPGFGVGCSACHAGAETTGASLRNMTIGLEPGDVAFKNAGFDLRMERMFMGLRDPAPEPPQPPPPVPLGTDVITFDSALYSVVVNGIEGQPVTPQAVPVKTYDVGWYHVGVRSPEENLGLGEMDAFGLPLSWTEYYQVTRPNPSSIKVPGSGLGCVDASGDPVSPPAAPLSSVFAGEVLRPGTDKPLLAGGLVRTEATAVDGSFKTPSLRNVDLTGPYLHNGGKATLRQVVEFYDDGGDFGGPTLSPLIRPLGLSDDQIAGLVAFLLSLTDERVLYERAPFDHPELPVPAGQGEMGEDLVTLIPAVGSSGRATPVSRFLGLNPFAP